MHEPAIITRSKFIFSWAKVRENVYHPVEIGFGFTFDFDWMKKWREFFKPIGLFRVALCLCVETSLRAKPVKRKCVSPTGTFSCKAKSFQGFVRRLVLKQAEGNSEMAYSLA